MYSFLAAARRAVLPACLILATGVVHAAAATLSGQPQTTVTAGQRYSFQPSLSGSNQFALFSISNKPTWAQFNRVTGALSGTPAASNVGTTSNIVITAYEWRGQASLAPFSIKVTGTSSGTTTPPAKTPPSAPVGKTPVGTAPANAAPVITGSPATTDTVGTTYSFRPSATDANGDALTFSVANKPAWATFDASTGLLAGTPTTAGQYANIVVSVTDGKTVASLSAFTIAVSAPVVAPTLGSATLTWQAPQFNTDGSPLTALAGFYVLYGTNPNDLTQTVTLPSPTYTSTEIDDLTPGTYYFAVKAYTQASLESEASPTVYKTIH